jgi:outer membrane protein OmpA-like peptidoglycan-associated protein
MKIASVLLATVGLFGISAAPVWSQSPAQTQTQEKSAAALYRFVVVARTTKAINYRHLSGPTKIDFRGTVLLPLARGEAKVESKRGAVRIQAQFDKLQPANQFGPEYLTYVLWAISPEGRAKNLGEAVLQGAKSKLDVTTDLQAFALIVTAEPYFAVMQPSDVVVLDNVVRPDTIGSVGEIDAKFELLQRGEYSKVSADYQPVRIDPRIPFGLYQARNALQIVKASGADRYAAESFQKAQQLLQQAELYQSRKAGKKQVEMTAREAVQTAEDARAITVKRQEEERLARERQAAAEREARAKAEAQEAARKREEAERAKLEAQLSAERAAREKIEAETARAAALAQQQAAYAEAERARQAADRAAREKAEAELARSAALAQQQAAQADAERARQAAEQAERLRRQAEAEKAELRARLLNQLNVTLQTRDTALGLTVNMSDVLFDTASYTLKPGAREKLAKISGIVLAYPGLNLQIEGHTDSVGGDEYNQGLSERRAGSVRDFLVQQGVPGSSITARGFGKTQPIASNDTPEGRQQNRRVEIVVTGDTIGAAAAANPPR